MQRRNRIIASIILVTFVIVFVNLPVDTKLKSEIKLVDKLTKENQEDGYPWSKDVTQVAKEAINRSIKNLKKPAKSRDKNFPSNPYDFEFSQKEITDFEIVGFVKESEDIYFIEFKPKSESKDSDSKIVVEINIETAKAIQVYMVADAEKTSTDVTDSLAIKSL